MHFLNKTWWWSAWYRVYKWVHAVSLPTAEAKKRSIVTTWSNVPQVLTAEKCYGLGPSTSSFVRWCLSATRSNGDSLAPSSHLFCAAETAHSDWQFTKMEKRYSLKSTSKMKIHFLALLNTWKKFSSTVRTCCVPENGRSIMSSIEIFKLLLHYLSSQDRTDSKNGIDVVV